MKRTAGEEYAWVGTVVQLVLGVIVGALVGLGVWFEFPMRWGWAAIPAGAGVFGVLAAAYGDRLWHGLGDYWNYW